MFTIWAWWLSDYSMSRLDLKFTISIDVIMEVILPLVIYLNNN